MVRYQLGDRIVPRRGLLEAPEWFNNGYVVISAICDEGTDDEHYQVTPQDVEREDISWIAQDEIDHVLSF